MRMKLLVLLFLLIRTKGFSQWPYLYQPPALYKQNHVKTRAAYFISPGKSEIVDSFDYNGMLVKKDFFTNATYIHYGKLELKYDEKGNPVKETLYRHAFYDSTKKKWLGYSDTIETMIVYDQMNRVIKKAYADTTNKFVSGIEYTYDPYIETTRYELNGHPYLRTVYYDEYFNVTRLIEKKVLPNGDIVEIVRREYTNVYDKPGRIKKYKFKDTPAANISPDLENAKTKCYYLDNGLLESRVYITKGGQKNKVAYVCTYW